MAGVEGVGVRVISDHRQGFAWAGSLETAVVDETLDEARDNAAFGEPDEWNGLPSPSDFETVAPAPLDVWRESLLAVPPDDKVTLAIDLERLVTRSLLAILGSALGGESVLKNRSMFVGRDGEQVAAPEVTLRDDPTQPDALGAGSHDAEGVPTRPVDLIAGGTLLGYLHNTYTGRRSGATTTGSAVRGGF